jgi:ABC-2 type transport system ATP-binding protein
VLVSSHVLAEVQQTVDDVVIIKEGRLVHAGPLAALAEASRIVVRSPEADRLAAVLAARAGTRVERSADGALTVVGITAAEIGHLAFAEGCELHELTTRADGLEQVFLELTADAS